jgi:hypothetical protein
MLASSTTDELPFGDEWSMVGFMVSSLRVENEKEKLLVM